MPKLKTHKGARKRFKITGTGKVLRSKAFRGHLRSTKSAKRRRDLRRAVLVSPGEARSVRRALTG